MDAIEVGPWYGPDTLPVRPGPYEIVIPGSMGPFYRKWDGVNWFLAADTPAGAMTCEHVASSNRMWRGVLK